MTNREKLATLSTADFWAEINDIKDFGLAEYTDFVAFLDSDDPEISHFVKHLGECWIAPSEADIKVSQNENSEPPKPRKGIVLGYRTIFEQPYVVVHYYEDIYYSSYCSVPANRITMI